MPSGVMSDERENLQSPLGSSGVLGKLRRMRKTVHFAKGVA